MRVSTSANPVLWRPPSCDLNCLVIGGRRVDDDFNYLCRVKGRNFESSVVGSLPKVGSNRSLCDSNCLEDRKKKTKTDDLVVKICAISTSIDMVEKLYYTFENVKDDLMTIIRAMTLDAWIPDVIVGPCRGAYISGVMLSHYFEKPFEGFVWQTRDGDQRDEVKLREIIDRYKGKNILVIDDINDSGLTMTGLKKEIDSVPGVETGKIKYGVLFTKTQSSFQEISYSAKTLTPDNNPWVVFPYEEWWGFRACGTLSSP